MLSRDQRSIADVKFLLSTPENAFSIIHQITGIYPQFLHTSIHRSLGGMCRRRSVHGTARRRDRNFLSTRNIEQPRELLASGLLLGKAAQRLNDWSRRPPWRYTVTHAQARAPHSRPARTRARLSRTDARRLQCSARQFENQVSQRQPRAAAKSQPS
jgi:hypothetical protein